jgi:hypothetical protein
MDKRRAERTRKRLGCTLELEDGRASGMILDVSAVGLFIQTGAQLEPGDRTTVEFEGPATGQPVRLQCRVARRRSVPVRLKAVIQAGVGVEIEHAPEEFFGMVAALQEVGAGVFSRKAVAADPPPRPTRKAESKRPPKPCDAAPAPAEKRASALSALRKRYRVEVHEIDGKGARVVEVEALNAGAAGRKALNEIGDGWEVAGCEVD